MEKGTLAVSSLEKHGPFAPYATNFESEADAPRLEIELNGDDFTDLVTTFGSARADSRHHARVLVFASVPEHVRMGVANILEPELRFGETVSAIEGDTNGGLVSGISVTISSPTGETRTEHYSLEDVLGPTDNSPQETKDVFCYSDRCYRCDDQNRGYG